MILSDLDELIEENSELYSENQALRKEVERLRAMVKSIAIENFQLSTWIEHVATDDQLDAPVPALDDLTARELFFSGTER